MNSSRNRILVVEDDLNLGYLLLDFLESENFEVKLARDGEAGLKAFMAAKFDLCVLDVMLPKKDGFTLATELRKLNEKLPIVFLTAKSFKEDKQNGFLAGADDYITKPFDETELLLRIRAILRRSAPSVSAQNQFRIGKYNFDVLNQSIELNGQIRRITAKEAQILKLLCESKDQILKRHEALNFIYGKSDYFHGRSFDVFITRLRKFLKEDPAISITNIHGVGFILSIEKSD